MQYAMRINRQILYPPIARVLAILPKFNHAKIPCNTVCDYRIAIRGIFLELSKTLQ